MPVLDQEVWLEAAAASLSGLRSVAEGSHVGDSPLVAKVAQEDADAVLGLFIEKFGTEDERFEGFEDDEDDGGPEPSSMPYGGRG
jgi:hypothetical protein